MNTIKPNERIRVGIMPFVLLSSALLLVTGCGKVSENNNEIASEPASLPSITKMPQKFEEYAVASNGDITIRGDFITTGPLSDIHTNQSLNLNAKKTQRFTGNLTAYRQTGNLDYKPVVKKGNVVNYSAKKVTLGITNVADLISQRGLANALEFTSKGGVLSYDPSGVATAVALSTVPGTWSFDKATLTWQVSGDRIAINKAMIFTGNLTSTANSFTVMAPLMVKGHLKTVGAAKVDIRNPFEYAVVVDGNISVNPITVVGKIQTNGSLTANGDVNLIGSIAANVGITFNGNTKINYLDTIYKGAQAKAQGAMGDVMLVHSQVFTDTLAVSNNTMALFTFVQGAYDMDEGALLGLIRTNTQGNYRFYSVLMGASGDYGSALSEWDGLAPYYENKIKVVDNLKAQGKTAIEVTESIGVGMDSLFHTYVDGSGGNITYLLQGDPRFGSRDNGEYVVMTSVNRDALTAGAQIIQTKISEPEPLPPTAPTTPVDPAVAAAADPEFNNVMSADTSTASNVAGKTAEQLRTEEWRELKDMPVETVSLEVQPVVDPTAPAAQGWFKRFVAAIIRVVLRCEEADWYDQLSYVDRNNPHDNWSRDVSMQNKTYSYCAPTAESMIVRYAGLKKRYTNLVSDMPGVAGQPTGFSYWSRQRWYSHEYRNEAALGHPGKLLNDFIGALGTDQKWGSINLFAYGPAFNKVLSPRGYSANVSDLSLYPTGLDPVKLLAMPTVGILSGYNFLFDRFRADVAADKPALFLAAGFWYGDSQWVEPHAMPVIGTRRKHYSGLCWLRPDDHWIYVDTEWAGGSEWSHKSWVRFDKWARPVTYWTGWSVTVN